MRNLGCSLEIPCKKHKTMSAKLGYTEHADWMEAQYRKGLRQKQCPDCKRWLFPVEWQ